MRDCEHCIHKIPVLKDGEWTVECESFDCEFISREACLMAYRNAEPKTEAPRGMSNGEAVEYLQHQIDILETKLLGCKDAAYSAVMRALVESFKLAIRALNNEIERGNL